MAAASVGFQALRVGLVAGSIAVVAYLHGDYGVTWDEPNQHQYGKHVVRYYETCLEDRSALTYLDAYLYGALFDSVAALLVRVSPLGPFETRHLVNALVGLAGILGLWKMTRLVGGGGAAALAAAMLFFEPNYFGHMFNNPKDIPFAVGYTWSLYFITRCIGQLHQVPWRLQLLTGLAIGLTLGVRIGGLLLLVYLAAVVLLALVRPSWAGEAAAAGTARERLSGLARSLAGIGVTAWIVMLVFWPWAQQNPLLRPLEALAFMSRFELTDSGLLNQVLIGGEYQPAKDLPLSYLPHYLGVKLPETVLLGLVAAAIVACLRWRQARDCPRRTARVVLLVASALAPAVYATAVGAVLYDTMRHFMFVVPPLCALSVLGWTAVAEPLARRLPLHSRRTVLGVAACLMLAPQAYRIAALHPHQYVHYNLLAGGLKGAEGRYELDYWANSYREAVELLREHVAGVAARDRRVVRVWAVGAERSASYYFPDYLVPVSGPEQADYVISFTRWDLHRRVPGRTIARVERQGAVLAVVKETGAGRRRVE